MNMTIYASDDKAVSAREIMERIAKDKHWAILAGSDMCGGTEFKIADVTRVGSYNVECDLLMWDDDPDETEYALFGVDNWCLATSLPEYLDESDGTTGIWGDGDNGQRYYLPIF